MSDNSNYDDGFMNDSSWASLFEMAESFEEQEDSLVCENVNFYESSAVKEERFHTPEEALKVLFGYDSFKEGQKQVIDSILSGRDAFAVMPTGAGKSVCYQIPAMMLSGITLVISPLISLMQDQVKTLNEAGVSAAFINSSLSESAFYETIRKARQGLYKIIYVAPERLVTEGFLELARGVLISMVTVDIAIVAIGAIYIVFRSLGKYFGAAVSCRWAKCEPQVCKYLGITLLPQAGVALGMCITARQLGAEGDMIRNIILFSVLVYELFGPLLTKNALKKAGEIQPIPEDVKNRRERRLAYFSANARR